MSQVAPALTRIVQFTPLVLLMKLLSTSTMPSTGTTRVTATSSQLAPPCWTPSGHKVIVPSPAGSGGQIETASYTAGNAIITVNIREKSPQISLRGKPLSLGLLWTSSQWMTLTSEQNFFRLAYPCNSVPVIENEAAPTDATFLPGSSDPLTSFTILAPLSNITIASESLRHVAARTVSDV